MADQPGRPPSALAAQPLVGREREQATLRDALGAALAGRGSLVLIGGEAGIGKTALAEATLAEATERGALVLIGRCYDLSETPPYGPWAEALARAPRGDAFPRPPELAGGGHIAGQAALFAAVRDYLAALATRQPLVLLLDDVHWADPASLDLLRVLGRGLSELSLLLLVTYRADELTRRHPLSTLLPVLVREARATRLDLRPLDEAALRTLVRERYALGADEEARLVTHLATQAEGNPFFVGELLRSLEGERVLRGAGEAWALGDLVASGVPPLLSQIIDARVDRLGDEMRGQLAIAAVIGQELPLALWAAVADLPEDALLVQAERAVEARLLTELPSGAGVRFAHALIREALYAGVPPLRRRSWHRRVGEALAATRLPDPDAVAYHFQRAGDERAAAWLVRAGERAQRTYAWLTAADRFEEAVALLGTTEHTASERGWLLFHVARLRRYIDPHSSVAYMDEAERLAMIAADRALATGALLERGLFHCFVGAIRRGLAEMEAGVAAYDALSRTDQARLWPLRMDDRSPVEDDGRGTLAMWLAMVGRYAEARAIGARAVSAIDATTGVARSLAAQGEPAAAAAMFERARATYRAIGHHSLVAGSAIAQLECVTLPYLTDRPAERRELTATALQARALTGGVVASAHDHQRLDRALLLDLEGQWTEARAILDALRGIFGRARWAEFASLLARLAYRQGDGETARAIVRDRLPDGHAAEPGDTSFYGAIGLQRVAAALAVEASDLPTARAWLDACDRWLDWAGATLGRAEGALAWAAYHRAAGDTAAAREHAARALMHASTPRQPLALLAAHRLLGELATADGRHADAAEHLAAALTLAEACVAPYERALTLLALAELRTAEGKPAQAGVALDDARASFADLAARPALARAEALAGHLAAPPAAAAPGGHPFGLTAREVEVLRLAAQGLTNAQVADRLFVTPRTVNAHLTSIYGKLGVANRAAAIRTALDHGLR